MNELSTMTPVKDNQSVSLSHDAIQAFDDLNGLHPGFRPAHAKGLLLEGAFTPSPGGSSLTRAPHLHRASTPITVRFSDFAGIPSVADNSPDASPRGMAIRFHLGDHIHTDIIAHSVDGFPARTAQEFIEFLRAIHASGPDAPKPTPIELFLASHPAALEFVQVPKPVPASFAFESFYAVNAYKFTNQDGAVVYGRYRIRPDGVNQYLDESAAAAKSPDFLFDELKLRIADGPVKCRIFVQLAEQGDTVDDSTIHWPENRSEAEFGIVEMTRVIENNDAEQRRIIFDPIPRVDGIDSSGDPPLEPRATVYLASGRRRRAAGAQ